MAEKQVLYKVDIKLGDAVDKLAHLEVQMDGISQSIKAKTAELKNAEAAFAQMADKDSEAARKEAERIAELRKEIIILKEQKKAVSKETGEYTRQVQNAIVKDNKYAGTLKGLCAQLSLAKDELRAMSMTDPEFAKKAEEVGKLNDKVKEMEAAYGVFTRNVGNYGMVLSESKEKVAQLVQEIARLTAAGQEQSIEFQTAKAQLDQYSNALAQEGTESTERYNTSLTAMMGALSIVSTVMGSDTEEGKRMAEVMQKLQLVTVGVSAVTQIYNTLQRNGTIQKIASNLQIKAGVAAITMETKATAGSTVAKTAATVAQKALNAAMNANPIILLISGIVALGTALFALVGWLVKNAAAQDEATQAQKRYEEQSRKTSMALDTLSAQEQARNVNLIIQHNKEIEALIKGGATKERIEKLKQKHSLATLELEKQIAEEKLKLQKEELDNALANWRAQNRELNRLIRTKGKDHEKTKEQMDLHDDARKAYLDAVNAYNSSVQAISVASAQIIEDGYTASVDAADKAFEKFSKMQEAVIKLRSTVLKRQEKYMYDYSKTAEENAEAEFMYKLEYDAKAFAEEQNQQKAKLKLQLKYNKITRDEYKKALGQMKADADSFGLEQAQIMEEHLRDLVNSAISLAGGKDLDGQLKDIRAKYKLSAKAIQEDMYLTEEEKAFYLQQLVEKQAQEERNVRLNIRQQTDTEIENKVKALYDNDLRQFSLNEDEKLAYEIDYLTDLVRLRKEAGLDTYAQEQQLLQLQATARANATNKELQEQWRSAREQYLTHKEFLEMELANEHLAADQRAAIEQELAELTASYNQQRIDSFENYASQVMDILSSIDSLMNNLGDEQVRKAEARNSKQKADLDKRLQAGLISQKQYDKKVAKMDEELDAEKAQIERKAAIRSKALSAMQIAINTAAAIMRIWADVPKVDFGVSTGVLTGLAAAAGALQLAAVLAEPLPTARQGGLVSGPTHERGGVLINTEGDERIISANPSRAFPELLNLISYIGKHSSIPDTGYASRYFVPSGGVSKDGIDYDILAEKIGEKFSEAVGGLQIYTAITDIRRADEEYSKIENSAKV